MADKKISALTASSTPLAGTEVLPIVQSGSTVKVSVANLTVGRSPTMNYAITQNGVIIQNSGVSRWFFEREAAAGDDLYLYRYNDAGGYAGNPLFISRSNGNVSIENNLAIRTSGNGIDFSATSGTGTSELLADYEEGDWTPVPTASSGTITSYTLGTCNYTKVGRMVTVNFSVTITNAGTASGSLDVPLPFTNGGAIANGSGRENALTGSQLQARVAAAGTNMNIQNYVNATAIATNAQIRASMTYFV